MAKNNWFQFKHFRVEQQKAAMKVGTDGVLLGAWVDTSAANTILDVGSGTGLIALMLAQRSSATITAVEIDLSAAEEALINFQNSLWRDRLTLIHDDFTKFSFSSQLNFDLIVSNPPYFRNALHSSDFASATARHDLFLTNIQLIRGAAKLLKIGGRLALILPVENTIHFIGDARQHGFYLMRQTNVYPLPGKKIKRVLLEFSNVPSLPKIDEICIHDDSHQYTIAYKTLTKNFYLEF